MVLLQAFWKKDDKSLPSELLMNEKNKGFTSPISYEALDNHSPCRRPIFLIYKTENTYLTGLL